MTLATVSQYLFVVASITLLLAFVATIAATTLRALGRRTAAVAAPDGVRLAGATVTVASSGMSGSSRGSLGSDARQPGATAEGIGHGLLWASLILLAASMTGRAV